LNEDGKQALSSIHSNTENSGIEITIPNLNGVLEKFLVWESSNFEPELQAKYPDIRAYAGRDYRPNSLILVCRHKECKL
jgi:hypothetical protein